MKKVVAFLLGVGLGLAAALTLAWGVLAPGPGDIVTEPSNLKPASKELYVVLVSMSYAQDGDLERAKARLALLNDPDLKSMLTRLAERYADELRPEARSLAKLAVAQGGDSPALRAYVPTATPTPTPSPTAILRSASTALATAQPSVTATRTPTRTPTPEPSATPLPRVAFRLFEQVRLTCAQEKTPRARILIYVQDASGQGIPGVKVRVQWNDGQDVFFTGLKGGDPGFADYDMQPGKSYSVLVLDGTSQVAFGLDTDLLEPECPNDGKEHFRAWRIVFRRSS